MYNVYVYIKEYTLQISQSYKYYSKQINSMSMISVNGFFPYYFTSLAVFYVNNSIIIFNIYKGGALNFEFSMC